MKTKIKRHSRSVISVLLAVCMLVSCMTVGLIATDAARISKDESVGAISFTSAKTVYFDNSWTRWSNVYLRVGHGSHCAAYVMSLVDGTENIYSYTFGDSPYSNAEAFHIRRSNNSIIFQSSRATCCSFFIQKKVQRINSAALSVLFLIIPFHRLFNGSIDKRIHGFARFFCVFF